MCFSCLVSNKGRPMDPFALVFSEAEEEKANKGESGYEHQLAPVPHVRLI